MVDLAELLVRDRAARGLGDVRQERHRRHHHVLHDRPGADRPAARSWSPPAPTTAPRPGARPGRPAPPRRTAPTSATTPTTTWPACGGPPPRPATTWRPSWSARSSTTPGYDQELVDPAFARGLRALCDATGAALILDDVRCGFRLHLGSSWEPIGVDARPVGLEQGDRQRPRARRGARQRRVPRRGAAGVRHRLVLVLRRPDGGRGRHDHAPCGEDGRSRRWSGPAPALRDGILAQAHSWDLPVNYTGPAAMPYLSFAGDADRRWPTCSRPRPCAAASTCTRGTTGSCRPP